MILLTATQVLLSPLLALALQVPMQDETSQEPEEAATELLYPIVETAVEGEGADPQELLDHAVKKMGGAFDKMRSISFVRESYHWRGDRLAYYDRHDTLARIEGGISGRVAVPSDLNPDTGRSLQTVFVANGDDRFMMMNRVVLAQENHEELAVQMLRGELFFILAPWLLAREHMPLRYDGRVQMEGWHGSVGGLEPETGARLAPKDYQQFVRTFHKVVAENPPEFVSAVGPMTELWFDVETGAIAYFRLQFRHKDSYNENLMLIEVVEHAPLEDGEIAISFRSTSRGDASTREEIQISNVVMNPPIDEKLLRRP